MRKNLFLLLVNFSILPLDKARVLAPQCPISFVNLSGAHISFIYTHCTDKSQVCISIFRCNFCRNGNEFYFPECCFGYVRWAKCHFFFFSPFFLTQAEEFVFREAKKLFDKLLVTLEIHVILLKLCTMCVRRNTKSIKKICQIVLDTYTELY